MTSLTLSKFRAMMDFFYPSIVAHVFSNMLFANGLRIKDRPIGLEIAIRN